MDVATPATPVPRVAEIRPARSRIRGMAHLDQVIDE